LCESTEFSRKISQTLVAQSSFGQYTESCYQPVVIVVLRLVLNTGSQSMTFVANSILPNQGLHYSVGLRGTVKIVPVPGFQTGAAKQDHAN
jgi:hypothetical protein